MTKKADFENGKLFSFEVLRLVFMAKVKDLGRNAKVIEVLLDSTKFRVQNCFPKMVEKTHFHLQIIVENGD